MAQHLGLATCFTVLACLLHPAVSEHKKKIIVKVPHIIKHIHHDVYKPIHVHKVHAKKLEHHYHEEHEEKPKWRPIRVKGGKHKAYGSYSHLQPVLLHQDSQEHVEHPVAHRQGLEYASGQNYGRGHEYSNEDDYSREADYSLEENSRERGIRSGDDNRHDSRRDHHQNYQGGLRQDSRRYPHEDSRRNLYHDPHQDSRRDLHNDPHQDSRRDLHHNPHQESRRDPHQDPHQDSRRDPHYDPHQDSREKQKWESINLGNWFGGGDNKDNSDEWLISSEDLRELREDYGILGGKGGLGNGQKRKKDKPIDLPKRPTAIDMEKDGWKPLMDFRGWKDVDELHKNSHRGYYRDYFSHSGEGERDSYGGEEVQDERESQEHNRNKRKKSGKNLKKNGKWSRQIEVREPSSEEDPSSHQRTNNSYNHHQNPPQISNVQLHKLHEQTYSQSQHQPYTNQQHKRPESLPNPQPQQYPQPLTTWSPPTPPTTPPTQPFSAVWSRHHLETPQHTMWQVQQHNVHPPVQLPVASSVFPSHSPPLVPLQQPLQPLNNHQSHQASIPVHRATPAPWPPVKKTPGVMQQWEQTVHMGDGAGPGSSYKVEVINYASQ